MARFTTFTPNDFFWKDMDSDDSKKSLEILNSMTDEQKWAVRVYASSRYEEGYSTGQESIDGIDL